MPFCEPCAKHWTPSSVNADGTCPTCGERLAAPRAVATLTTPPPSDGLVEDGEPKPKAPWHFKLLLGALVLYLGWRGVQGIEWLAEHV